MGGRFSSSERVGQGPLREMVDRFVGAPDDEVKPAVDYSIYDGVGKEPDKLEFGNSCGDGIIRPPVFGPVDGGEGVDDEPSFLDSVFRDSDSAVSYLPPQPSVAVEEYRPLPVVTIPKKEVVKAEVTTREGVKAEMIRAYRQYKEDGAVDPGILSPRTIDILKRSGYGEWLIPTVATLPTQSAYIVTRRQLPGNDNRMPETKTPPSKRAIKVTAFVLGAAILYGIPNYVTRDYVCKTPGVLTAGSCVAGKVTDSFIQNIPLVGQISLLPSKMMDVVYEWSNQEARTNGK